MLYFWITSWLLHQGSIKFHPCRRNIASFFCFRVHSYFPVKKPRLSRDTLHTKKIKYELIRIYCISSRSNTISSK
ncbi:hypothetical protein Hanom_Chr03g00195911 [Helianthus anomalus]